MPVSAGSYRRPIVCWHPMGSCAQSEVISVPGLPPCHWGIRSACHFV